MSRYRNRARDFAYMGAVKLLPCLLRGVAGAGDCDGPVEADHAGERAFARKAPDDTCIPLCRRHHRDRTDMRGIFKTFDRVAMRAWCDERIAETRRRVREPTCFPISF